MYRTNAFKKEYHLVRLLIEAGDKRLPADLFIRRAGKIGIERSEKGIRIPGYLFSNTDTVGARMGEDHRFYVTVPPNDPVTLERVSIDPGTWEIAVHSPVDSLRFSAMCGDGVLSKLNDAADGNRPFVIHLDAETPMRFSIASDAGAPEGSALYELSLKRVTKTRAVYTCR